MHVFKILLCYKVSFYYYVYWVYLIAREHWHIANSFTCVQICQPFNIYCVLNTKRHWLRGSCNSLIITFLSSSNRLLAILADFLSYFRNIFLLHHTLFRIHYFLCSIFLPLFGILSILFAVCELWMCIWAEYCIGYYIGWCKSAQILTLLEHF